MNAKAFVHRAIQMSLWSVVIVVVVVKFIVHKGDAIECHLYGIAHVYFAECLTDYTPNHFFLV